MPRPAQAPFALSRSKARRIWLRAQRLDERAPFGAGPEATRAAVEHLGYVQIDTINVIERCHHHILFTRIPGLSARPPAAGADRRQDGVRVLDACALVRADRGHAVLPRRHEARLAAPQRLVFGRQPQDLRKVLARIRKARRLTIRDIDDDVLVEKYHLWASRKPSKRALQLAFYRGLVTVSQRAGMLKTYELTSRHFGWERPPKTAIGTGGPELSARPGPAIAGCREPRFGLLSGRPAQARHRSG